MHTLNFSWFEQGPNFDGLSSSLGGDISVKYQAMPKPLSATSSKLAQIQSKLCSKPQLKKPCS